MESKAKISDVSKDFHTGKFKLTFICDSVNPEELDRLSGKEIRLRAVQWREKRSLSANGYLWALCEQIASEMASTKEEVYELMLKRYGTIDRDKDGVPITIKNPINQNMDLLSGHWLFIHQSSDGESNVLVQIKGSSKYDTKEMSVLLDGVVSEAKDLGIEVMTPNEIAKMKALWGKEA